MSKKSVTVLMGGPDAERDVSIDSGTAVASALEQSGDYDIHLKLIDRPDASDIASIDTDVVFPALHGPFGEGGPLQLLLEAAGIPFVGSGSKASSNAMDKDITKTIAQQATIQTPQWCILQPEEVCTLHPPLVLKPICDGSSIDIVVCMDDAHIASARSTLHQNRTTLLAESFVEGREITIGILDGTALPIIEIVPPEDLGSYDYAAKYERDDTQFILDPMLPKHSCVESALQLYDTMDLRDIARADFILNDEGAWFLEINTMPGFTNHSLIPMAAQHAGISMMELCSKLVEIPIRRAASIGA